MSTEMPTIAEVAAKFAPNTAPVHEQPAPDANSGKGGTTSDPSLQSAPEAVVEAPAAEAPKAEEKPIEEKPKKDPQGSRFAALARRMKDALSKETELSAKAKEIEAREQAIKDREARLSAKGKRPLDLLKEHGFQYNDALQDFMGGYKPPEPDPLDQKLSPLREQFDKLSPDVEKMQRELSELKSQLTQKQQQESYESAMKDIRAAASNEKYELINAMGDDAIDLVRDTVVEYFNRNQKLLDYSEACDIVERYYEDEYLSRLVNTKKLQSKLPKPTTSKPSAPAKEATSSKQTLTQATQTAPQATIDLDKMSRNDAIAYLAKKLVIKPD